MRTEKEIPLLLLDSLRRTAASMLIYKWDILLYIPTIQHNIPFQWFSYMFLIPLIMMGKYFYWINYFDPSKIDFILSQKLH